MSTLTRKGPTLAGRGSVALPTPVMDEYSRLLIRVAGEIGRVPNSGQLVSAMLSVANNHYQETLDTLIKIREGERQ